MNLGIVSAILFFLSFSLPHAHAATLTTSQGLFQLNHQGEVREISAEGLPLRQGQWRAMSTDRSNLLLLQFGNETPVEVSVHHGINSNNQLTLQALDPLTGTGMGEAIALKGDVPSLKGGLNYRLLDERGYPSAQILEIPARFDFSEDHKRMRVLFRDQTVAYFHGYKRKRGSLSTHEYVSGGDHTRDQLTFGADIRNVFGGDTWLSSLNAKFYGRWIIRGGNLVFLTHGTENGEIIIGHEFEFKGSDLLVKVNEVSSFVIPSRPIRGRDDRITGYRIGFSAGELVSYEDPSPKDQKVASKTGSGFQVGPNFKDIHVNKRGSVVLPVLKFRLYLGPNGFVKLP